MIALKINYKKLFVGFLAITLAACSDPWGDRQKDDENLNRNLVEAISNNPETAKFGELLVKTGYDKLLSESKTFTVFAPTNQAIEQLDAAVSNDPTALKLFVENHIAVTEISSIRDKASEKIKMLSEKYLLFKGSTTIGDATIVDADNYTKNGIFHVVNKTLSPKLNIWQYVNSMSDTSAMSKYMLSLTELNIYKADSIAKLNPIAGIYSDSLTNCYLRNVYNLNNEANSYTLFLMEDDGYTAETDKLKPYLIKNSADRTNTYTSYFTTRDLAFPKAYQPNELPTTLTTRFGVEVTIDKSQIVRTIQLSNGIVYIMKKVEVALAKRLVPTKIEGEKPNSYFPNTSTNNSTIFYRDNKDPDGVLFKDIMQYHRATEGPNFFINYSAKDLYSTTYKVSWRAINNTQSNVFQQRLVVGTVYKADGTIDLTSSLFAFPYMNVELKTYTDVYIGEFNMLQAGNLDTISLVSAVTTTIGNNSLTLDYLKFEPVIK